MSITKQETWNLIFKRKGEISAHTKPFELFNEETRKNLIEQASLREDEVPVIGYYENSRHWLLITTERIISTEEGRVFSIENSTVETITPFQFGMKRKTEMNELEITDKQGAKRVVSVEPGLPFFGIWNVLRNISIRND